MRQRAGNITESGVITVYLALILLLILSLICTIIEGARVSTAKIYTKRALSTAMDSVWAEYYGPLWEEYHIFGYDAGAGSMGEQASSMENKLTDYMSYTFEPDSGLDTANYPAGIELYKIRTASTSVTEQTRLMDYNGELLINEAVEYMKYHELGDGLTMLLDKASLLEAPKKVSYVYDKKLSAEEELAKSDKNILRLMELLDGIKTSKSGIKFDKRGNLISKVYFAKKLCLKPITMESVGINHKAVFDAVKEHYINPADSITRFKSKTEELITLEKQIAGLQEEISSAQASLSNIQVQLQTSDDTKASKKEKQMKDALREERESIQNDIQELRSRIDGYRERIWQVRSEAETELSKLEHILDELLPITEEALKEAEAVMENAAKSIAFIKTFEDSINEYGDDLSEEVKGGFLESLNQMKQYTSYYEGNENYHNLYDILKDNRIILMDSQRELQSALKSFQKNDTTSARENVSQVLLKLQNYHIRDLSLDYSGLVIKQAKQQNPFEEIGALIESGITGLVIDTDQISDKKMEESQLPSTWATLQQDSSNFTAMIKAFLADMMEGGDKMKMSSLLQEFNKMQGLDEGIKKGIQLISERLLFQEYLKEHFESYTAKGGIQSNHKPSELDYEQEYLLAGNFSDKENLSSVVTRIVFIRMMLNFVTLLGDKSRCEEAKLMATAIVGFSGLPILISITQAALLLVWSFTESLVDTCVLLGGKSVPVLKQKLFLTLPEIFLMNRSFLKTKAEAYKESKQLCMSYVDYLRFFLLTKDKKELAYRSMDLIQENLGLRYEDNFSFRNCLYGFSVEAEYTVGSSFLAISFVRRAMAHKVNCFTFHSTSAYSY